MKQVKYFKSEIKDIDESKGIVQFYGNAFDNMDSDHDISAKGSFTKTLKEFIGRMKWYLNHNTNILLGVPFVDGGKQDNFGLLATNQFNMKKEVARDTFEDYKLFADHGRSLEHSIGVDAITHKTLKGNDIPRDLREKGIESVRVVSEWKLWEVSTLTSWGANERTPLIDIKSLNEIDSTLSWLEKMKDRNYTDERHKNIELTISTLLSLKNEPFESTPKEPEDNTLIEPMDAAKYLLNNLKCLKDG
jgi:HK97 family phage prohead protease